MYIIHRVYNQKIGLPTYGFINDLYFIIIGEDNSQFYRCIIKNVIQNKPTRSRM